MVEMNVVYEGGLHCKAVHGPSGASLETDAPADNMGRGESYSPTDLAAVSLLTCMLTTMGIAVEKKGLGVELRGTRGSVRKIMTSEPPRRIARLEVDIALPLAETHPACAELESAALGCPVARSLHPDVVQVVSFHWQGE